MGSFLSAIDMQSGSPSFGGPESVFGLYASGQIARRYGLPWRAGGGTLTASQSVDAQAALRVAQHPAGRLHGRRERRLPVGRLARERPRRLLREVRPRHRDAADAAPPVHARDVRRGIARVLGARRDRATAATSSAPSTRWSASANASGGRRWPRPRTSSAGSATGRWTRARAPRRSGAPTSSATSARRLTRRSRQELSEFVERRTRELGDDPFPLPGAA